jgi:hypothetical protein
MTFGLSGAAMAGLAVAGATVYAANKSASAASDASQTQANSTQAGIDTANQRFEQIQKLLAPYVTAGNGALTAQQDLLGLNGAPAQQTAVNNIESMPYFQGLVKQGETGILANASATGGVRGGNVQAALGQFRPQLLASLIQQQFQNLGGISQLGQASAAGVGNAGLTTGSNVAQLLGEQGAALAGGDIASARASANIPAALLGGLGVYKGLGGALSTAPTVPAAAPVSAPGGYVDNQLF